MILVRDSSYGLLKHLHIGQVTIPIECFLYQTEAAFILPLESTYRMKVNDQIVHLGEIQLTTELVDIANTKGEDLIEDSKPKISILGQSNINSSKVQKSKNSESQMVFAKYVLRRTTMSSCCWPFKLIRENLFEKNLSCEGWFHVGFDNFTLFLWPKRESPLKHTKEFIDGKICLSWEMVN
jgi:hypothetical protein